MAISFGETFVKVQECFKETQISSLWTRNLQSITIIRDVYGAIRLYLEPDDSFQPQEADITILETSLSQKLGSYYGKDIWLPQGEQDGYKPYHLQDAGGRIAPRSFLKLFSLAANRRLEKINEQNEQSLLGTILLQPSDLQGALMDTSLDRIRELAQEEYPWLEALKTSLTGLEVPTLKSKFLELLTATQWSEQSGKRPPTTKPEEVLNYLLRLGIVESRSDGRINMPEIYLYGFKVKRRGGIKRPN
jgi:hypothetical protein